MRRKKNDKSNQYAEQQGWVFSLDLKKRVKTNAGQKEEEGSRS